MEKFTSLFLVSLHWRIDTGKSTNNKSSEQEHQLLPATKNIYLRNPEAFILND